MGACIERLRYGPGDRLIRPDEIRSEIHLVLKGQVRLIGIGNEQEGPFTLDKRGPGDLVGWTSLLRESTEFVQASTDVVTLSLPAQTFVRLSGDPRICRIFLQFE